MANKKKGASKPQRRKRKREIPLMVIPEDEAKEHAVLEYTGEGTVVMQGESPASPTMVCGKCRAPLIVGVPMRSIQRIVFRCKNCRALNESLA